MNKIKLPKKVRILNREFDVVRGDNYLGYFLFKDPDNENKPTIGIISNKKASPEVILEAYLHETLEISLELLRARYGRPDERDSYEFHYEHKQHDAACKIMAGVVKQLVEINK